MFNVGRCALVRGVTEVHVYLGFFEVPLHFPVVRYLQEAVAEVSKDKTHLGKTCEIQLVWDSTGLNFDGCDTQMVSDDATALRLS